MMLRFTSFAGLLSFIFIAYALSQNRRAIRWKPVIAGALLQFFFALVILKTSFGQAVFASAADFFNAFLGYAAQGGAFVFGPLINMEVTRAAFGPANAFIFAFQISATIIFVSAVMAVAYHLGIMQKIVYAFALVMQKVIGTSGSESLAAAANIFMGQTETPLVIRPYLEKMTRSEVMCLMTGGMATIAGGVLAAYIGLLQDHFPDIAGHLLAASVMSAPATLVIAKIMVPETEVSETAGSCKLNNEKNAVNFLDAACKGASEGVTLAINVMGMLIAFIALVAMTNGIIQWVGAHFVADPPTLEVMLGWLFSPLAFLMGVPHADVTQVGSLLGIKTVLNEFVGYLKLLEMKDLIAHRSYVITTYAMCGFANFSSVAIQIGGIGSLIPSRRADLAVYGLRAMVGGTLASFMTAAIAGMLL